MSKHWLQVFISDQARKEILEWPLEIRKDLGAILTKLQKGSLVSYPDTKPISTVGSRLKDASGAFRAFYVIKTKYGIVLFHSFKKKTQKTPKQEIETGRLRLNAYLKELGDESKES